jgi:hypothetical protein
VYHLIVTEALCQASYLHEAGNSGNSDVSCLIHDHANLPGNEAASVSAEAPRFAQAPGTQVNCQQSCLCLRQSNCFSLVAR